MCVHMCVCICVCACAQVPTDDTRFTRDLNEIKTGEYINENIYICIHMYVYIYIYIYVYIYTYIKARENGSQNRFLSRARSVAKRECEP